MFKPYENDTESTAIEDLTLENQTDCINLYGDLQITRDQYGLQIAKELQALLNAIVAELEADPALPEKIQRTPEGEIDNPFS